MELKTESYLSQKERWSIRGKVILAQYDRDSIVVYQAYRPSIGHFAVENQYFGGEFKLSRMTWIKPNFMWMMYRSGWGTKPGQEVILAVRIKRFAFDLILSQAVISKYDRDIYDSQKEWNRALQNSNVRLQWDPDHSPTGGKLQRRAIQLGLRNEVAVKYAQEWIIEITDISSFVAQQRENAITKNYDCLLTPYEEVYPIDNLETAKIIYS